MWGVHAGPKLPLVTRRGPFGYPRLFWFFFFFAFINNKALSRIAIIQRRRSGTPTQPTSDKIHVAYRPASGQPKQILNASIHYAK